ncbi:hypothetical protein BN961_01775 [Afipia felis]|uniref:Uncharacterized protein n=1 Tax=Afipia felis TaxID=1035 RepID=A0A090MLU0_AFIFE|nr:hypothetical protein BN961_01775 [Afipia felis]
MTPCSSRNFEREQRIERQEDLRLMENRRDRRNADDREPEAHQGAEKCGDPRGAARLYREQCCENDDRQRHDIRVERFRRELHAFDGGEDRQRGRDDGIAIEQGAADDAEQDQPPGRRAERALRQRHQRERAAFPIVVGAQQDDDIFQRHHHDQRPEDQRQHAQHDTGLDAPRTGRRIDRFAEGMQR